jgi:hypothetical protein
MLDYRCAWHPNQRGHESNGQSELFVMSYEQVPSINTMRTLNRYFFLLLCVSLSPNAQAYSLNSAALINNGGDLGKTLDDMGKSENVHALLTAMVTAGVLQGLNTSLDMQKVNANKSGFGGQLQKNLIDNTASTVVNHALNGGDFQQQLEQSLKSAFIDTGAAQSANKIGDLNTHGDLNAFTHQLAHAIAGCAAGAAKSNDCGSGALGAAVGEMAAEWYGGNRSNASNFDIPALQTDTVNFARMISGIAAAVTGNDVNAGAGAGGNAAQNNYLAHWQIKGGASPAILTRRCPFSTDRVKPIEKRQLVVPSGFFELIEAPSGRHTLL